MRLTEQEKTNIKELSNIAKHTTRELYNEYINDVLGQITESNIKQMIDAHGYAEFNLYKHDFYTTVAWMYINEICNKEQFNHFKYIFTEFSKVLLINRGWKYER